MLPHMQPADTLAGLIPHLPIELSDDADMDYVEDSDGDMYDLRGDYPPPYAQHDIGDTLTPSVWLHNRSTLLWQTLTGRLLAA